MKTLILLLFFHSTLSYSTDEICKLQDIAKRVSDFKVLRSTDFILPNRELICSVKYNGFVYETFILRYGKKHPLRFFYTKVENINKEEKSFDLKFTKDTEVRHLTNLPYELAKKRESKIIKIKYCDVLKTFAQDCPANNKQNKVFFDRAIAETIAFSQRQTGIYALVSNHSRPKKPNSTELHHLSKKQEVTTQDLFAFDAQLFSSHFYQFQGRDFFFFIGGIADADGGYTGKLVSYDPKQKKMVLYLETEYMKAPVLNKKTGELTFKAITPDDSDSDVDFQLITSSEKVKKKCFFTKKQLINKKLKVKLKLVNDQLFIKNCDLF